MKRPALTNARGIIPSAKGLEEIRERKREFASGLR